MADELRVPIERVDARVFTDEGRSHPVTLFLPAGQGAEHVLGAPGQFFPMSEAGEVRIVARSTIAAIAVPRAGSVAPRPEDELLTERRALRITLRGGAVIEGVLRHGVSSPRTRTADLLNESTPTLTLEHGGFLHHIAKAHIACVDEITP